MFRWSVRSVAAQGAVEPGGTHADAHATDDELAGHVAMAVAGGDVVLNDSDGVEKVILAPDHQRRKLLRGSRIGEVLRYIRQPESIAHGTIPRSIHDRHPSGSFR